MASLRVLVQLSRADLPQRTLRGFLVVQIHEVGVGGNNKQIYAEVGGQRRGGAVFVDDGFDALQSSVVPDHRNPSASARDDQHALLDQIANDLEFNNVNRIRRRNHAAITAGRVLDDLPSEKAFAFLGIGARIERTDRLAGVLHRGIVWRHQALGKNRRNRHVQIGQLQFGLQRLLEKISDLTLGRGATNVQRMPRDLARSAFRAQKRCPNLRTVAMREHDPVAGADQADDLGRGPLGICPLFGDRSLFARANQGVSANGKEHGLHKQCAKDGQLSRTRPSVPPFARHRDEPRPFRQRAGRSPLFTCAPTLATRRVLAI